MSPLMTAARFRANAPPAVEKSQGARSGIVLLSSSTSTSTSTWSRRDRDGTLCKSSAEVYQHQRHPRVSCPRSSSPSVVVLLLRFTLLRTFPRDDPLCVLLATENASHPTTMTTTTTTSTTTVSDSPRFILSLSWPSLLLSTVLPSSVFHCRPLFRLLLLTSFVRTSLQRKKGEKGRGRAREATVRRRKGESAWKFRFAR